MQFVVLIGLVLLKEKEREQMISRARQVPLLSSFFYETLEFFLFEQILSLCQLELKQVVVF
jgi:hypothetical protein